MSRIAEICECSKPNNQKKCRIACGKPRYQGEIKTWPLNEYSPVYFVNGFPRFPQMSDEEIDAEIERVKAQIAKMLGGGDVE